MMDEKDLNDVIYAVLKSAMDPSFEFKDSVGFYDLVNLVNAAKETLDQDPILLKLHGGIHVVGDIHGNLDDLLRIFEKCGYPPSANYLFLGDYIDRGSHSIEVFSLLLALKCKYPEHIYLLRGNHETIQISKYYGFMKECSRKYNSAIYTEFSSIFPSLPLAAIIGNAIFCVHGGISPLLTSVKKLALMSKPMDNPRGIFVDMIWSDPNANITTFIPSKRGIGYHYGLDAVREFLDSNGLQMMIRSHEECQKGLNWCFRGSKKCVTVFSNSDYCGHGNSAAVVTVSESLVIGKAEFVPLTSEAKQKRRVVLPVWILEHITSKYSHAKTCDSDSADGDSQPEELLLLPYCAIDV